MSEIHMDVTMEQIVRRLERRLEVMGEGAAATRAIEGHEREMQGYEMIEGDGRRWRAMEGDGSSTWRSW